DPAGEAALLALLQDELHRTEGLATYNGSRFDLPLLRTRWVMARMPGELEHPAHLDLLTLTRSLLRQRLEHCTLRLVEEHLLGFERERDVAGALVPQELLRLPPARLAPDAAHGSGAHPPGRRQPLLPARPLAASPGGCRSADGRLGLAGARPLPAAHPPPCRRLASAPQRG